MLMRFEEKQLAQTFSGFALEKVNVDCGHCGQMDESFNPKNCPIITKRCNFAHLPQQKNRCFSCHEWLLLPFEGAGHHPTVGKGSEGDDFRRERESDIFRGINGAHVLATEMYLVCLSKHEGPLIKRLRLHINMGIKFQNKPCLGPSLPFLASSLGLTRNKAAPIRLCSNSAKRGISSTKRASGKATREDDRVLEARREDRYPNGQEATC